jgi:serine/threonine protein kinase/DNA-binding CsgD family transcriptional regulator
MSDQPPPLLKDRYRLVEPIGQGSMAMVYRARDILLERDVAIKFLAPRRLVSSEASERFIREARTIAQLNHPNIMHLYDAGREESWHYQVLEYIAGRDLRGWMLAQKPTLADILHLIRGTLYALDYAHQHGVIHRDIKPENIMITPEQQVKVTDFGLALNQRELRLTQDDVIIGTVFYLAPEVIAGKTADSRTDLYAVGVVFYELLTGAPPFTGDLMMSVISQIVHAPVTFPDDIPPLIRDVITRLLAKDPEARFASAAEVVNVLPELSSTPPPEIADSALFMYAALEDKSLALEAERRHLAGLLQSSIIDPVNLLLAQVNLYNQTLAMNQQTRMVTSVLASLARQVLQQARDLEANLHPTILETLGLELALESLVNQMTRSSGVQIQFQTERLHERLPPTIELALFRAVQDILNYAIRQARASSITVQLQSQNNQVGLILTDNGQENVLRFDRARLEQLGGQVGITPNPTGGLTVSIVFSMTPPPELTPREMDVIQQLARGLGNKKIAALLGVSPRTVNFHLDNIYSKLGVNSRTEAVIYALRQGWVRSDLFK